MYDLVTEMKLAATRHARGLLEGTRWSDWARYQKPHYESDLVRTWAPSLFRDSGMADCWPDPLPPVVDPAREQALRAQRIGRPYEPDPEDVLTAVRCRVQAHPLPPLSWADPPRLRFDGRWVNQCKACGKEFPSTHHATRTCSYHCSLRYGADLKAKANALRRAQRAAQIQLQGFLALRVLPAYRERVYAKADEIARAGVLWADCGCGERLRVNSRTPWLVMRGLLKHARTCRWWDDLVVKRSA